MFLTDPSRCASVRGLDTSLELQTWPGNTCRAVSSERLGTSTLAGAGHCSVLIRWRCEMSAMSLSVLSCSLAIGADGGFPLCLGGESGFLLG